MRALVVVALPILLTSGEGYAEHDSHRFRLELVIQTGGSGTYITAWGDGDVIAGHDGSDKKPVTYRRAFRWYDGCDWESQETLVPTAPDRYTYSYREGAVSCPNHTTPDGSVQRAGTVYVHPAPDRSPLTPLVSTVTLPR